MDLESALSDPPSYSPLPRVRLARTVRVGRTLSGDIGKCYSILQRQHWVHASITILKLMADANVPGTVRLRAAACVFDCSIKGLEVDDIEARVAALEAAAASGQQRR